MTQNTPFATHTTQNNLYYGKYCKGRKNDNNRAWRTLSWVSSRLERLKLQLNCRVLIGVCFVFVTGCVWSTRGDIAGHILRNWSRVPRLTVVTRYCQQ